MTARTILDRAKAAGLSLRVDGTALVCSPASKATQELLAEIWAHKAELMALLVDLHLSTRPRWSRASANWWVRRALG